LKSHNLLVGITFILIALVISGLGCGGSKKLSNLTAQELFEAGKEKYEQGKYLKAVDYFQSIVYNYPGVSIIDTAQYYLGLSYFGNNDYTLAQAEFNRLIMNYPSSVFFESAMLLRAVSVFQASPKHYGLDQTELEQAIQMLNDFVIDFPESDYLPEAREYILQARTRMARKYYTNATVYARMGARDASKTYYQIVIDDYTDTEYAPLAVFGMAEAEYRSGEYEKAQKKFDDFRTMYPDNEMVNKAKSYAMDAAFKCGESAFEKGDFETAQKKMKEFIDKYGRTDKYRFIKAYDYLEKIKHISKSESRVENEGSR